MTKDLNYFLDQYWLNLYKKINRKAEKQASGFINALNFPQNENEYILFLIDQLKLLALEIESLGSTYKFIFDRSKLYYCFLSRLLINGKNDYATILQTQVLRTKKEKLQALLFTIAEQYPPFTYNDFISDKYDPFFYNLDELVNLNNKEDYIKSRIVQCELILNSVFHNVYQMQFSFVQVFNHQAQKGELLFSELQILDAICSNKICPNTDIQKVIKQLSGLKNVNLSNFSTDFNRELIRFFHGSINYYTLTYSSLKDYQLNDKVIDASLSVIVGLTLLKYLDWLKQIPFTSYQIPKIELQNVFLFFENTVEDAKQLASDQIKQFKTNSYNQLTSTPFQYELEYLRKRINKLSNTIYFNILENKDLLKLYFLQNCITQDIYHQQKNLTAAILLNEELT